VEQKKPISSLFLQSNGMGSVVNIVQSAALCKQIQVVVGLICQKISLAVADIPFEC
jgi:hypothetical protein